VATAALDGFNHKLRNIYDFLSEIPFVEFPAFSKAPPDLFTTRWVGLLVCW
jgi:hypothetical protein